MEKTLRLESRKRFPLSHRHCDEKLEIEFYRGLLRSNKDETTVERRAGKPGLVYGRPRPIALSRTGTRRIIIEAGEKSPTVGRIHLRRLLVLNFASSCSQAADHTFTSDPGRASPFRN